MIVSSFDIEKEIKDYQREQNENNNDDDVIDPNVGDVIEVIKTIEVNKTNEYIVLSKEGMFFIKIKQVKKPSNNVTF